MLYNRGNLFGVVNLLRRLPPEIAGQRPWLNAYNGFFLAMSGQVDQAEEFLQWAERSRDDSLLLGFVATIRSSILYCRLQLHPARQYAQFGLDNIPPGNLFINCFSLYCMGRTLINLGDLDAAQTYIQQALTISETHDYVSNVISALGYLTQIALLKHDLVAAETYLHKAERYCAQNWSQTRRLTAFWQMFKAELLYQQQQLDDALAVAEQAIENSVKYRGIVAGVQSYLVQSRILDALARETEAAAAITAARKLREAYPFFLDLLALIELEEVRHALHMGDLAGAAAHLSQCDPGEAVLFERQKQNLMTQYATLQALPPQHPDLIEQLSPREIDVLRLIAEGLSNQAIAEELCVSLSTVKKHSSSVYGKLGVSSRIQAIHRAQELGLLR